MYIVNKTNSTVKLSFSTSTVDLLPYGHYEVVDTFYLPEIKQLLEVFEGKIDLVDDITKHLEEKDAKLENDYKNAIEKASSDILNVIKYMSNEVLRPSTQKLVEFLTAIGVENPYDAIVKAGIPTDDALDEEIQGDSVVDCTVITNIPVDRKDINPELQTGESSKDKTPLVKREINTKAREKILSLEISDDKKLEVVRKIADYKEISYSPKAGIKNIVDKILK